MATAIFLGLCTVADAITPIPSEDSRFIAVVVVIIFVYDIITVFCKD